MPDFGSKFSAFASLRAMLRRTPKFPSARPTGRQFRLQNLDK
jgi:hypothetical protein